MNIPPVTYIPCFPVKLPYPGAFHPQVQKLILKHKHGLTLNVCAGVHKEAINIDLNPDVHPTIIAEAGHLPLRSKCVDTTVTDPPYSAEQSKRLYHGRFTGDFMREIKRVTKHTVIWLAWHVAHLKRPFHIQHIYLCDQGGNHPSRKLTIVENLNTSLT